MKAIRIAFRRARALLQIRILEIALQDQHDSMAQVFCKQTRSDIQQAMDANCQALRQARSHYLALPRLGQRPTWRTA